MLALASWTGALSLVAGLAGCTSGGEVDEALSSTTSTPTSSQSSPADTPTQQPPEPAPKLDACRDLGFPDINRYSNETDTVPCDQPHTAFTFAVAQLPDDVAFDGVDIKNDAVQEAAADQCRQRFASYVGGDAGTRALVRLTMTYFLPSQAEFDRGAHWVRCDVVALQAEQILAELPSTLAGALDRPAVVQDYSLCSVAEPGTAGSVMVTCNQEHEYRAISALRLGADSDDYPGEDVTRTEGRNRCEALIQEGVDAEGGYTFSWTYPTPRDWNAGQRFGYCWQKTSG